MFYFILWFLVICVLLYVYARLSSAQCKSSVTLVGKTAIVTGGSSGIGYHTALGLASRGCKVIIASRTCNEELKKKIIKETNNPNIISKKLDLSSYESVREFATDINTTEERLDILINNAGTGYIPKLMARDNVPSLMKLNHLGPFLLTHLLADLLKKTSRSRIIFVSSIGAFLHNIKDAEDIKRHPTHKGFLRKMRNQLVLYSNTKFCNLITSDGFAKRLEKYGVTSNSCHPGSVHTDIFEKFLRGNTHNFLYRLAFSFLGLVLMKEGGTMSKRRIDFCAEKFFHLLKGQFQPGTNICDNGMNYHDTSSSSQSTASRQNVYNVPIKEEDNSMNEESLVMNDPLNDGESNIESNITKTPEEILNQDNIIEQEEFIYTSSSDEDSSQVLKTNKKRKDGLTVNSSLTEEYIKIKLEYKKQYYKRMEEEAKQRFALEKQKIENELTLQSIKMEQERLKLEILRMEMNSKS